MQLTTINKIISYLLVGSLAATLIALGFKDSIPDKLPDGAKLIVPLIFLATAAFLGCVIEGLRATLARYVLRGILNPSNENKPHWIAAVLAAFPELLRIINFAVNNFIVLFFVKKKIIQKLLLC